MLVAAIVMALSMNASAFVIDHFEDPFGGDTLTQLGVGTVSKEYGSFASIWGGYRLVTGNVTTDPNPSGASFQLVSNAVPVHKFVMSTGGSVIANAVLGYGSYSTTGGAQGVNMSADYGLTFRLLLADNGGQVTMDIDANGTVYSLTQGLPTYNGSGMDVGFPFSSFPGLVASGDLVSVDGIQLTLFSPTQVSWDVEVDSISTNEPGDIPEPGTIALLCLGLAGLARRRRKS